MAKDGELLMPLSLCWSSFRDADEEGEAIHVSELLTSGYFYEPSLDRLVHKRYYKKDINTISFCMCFFKLAMYFHLAVFWSEDLFVVILYCFVLFSMPSHT